MSHIVEAIPRYRKVYLELKEQITAGVFQPGDILPSEQALSTQYELTRPTIRQSLSELVREGLIVKQKGIGSIVQKPKTGIGILNIRGTTASSPTGTLTTEVIDAPELIDWPTDLAFEVPAALRQFGCIRLSRLRSLYQVPVFYEETYLPNINLPRFTQRSFTNKSLFGILSKHYDISVTGGEQRIRSIVARGRICDLLNLSSGLPILHLDKKYDTNRSQYHFFTTLWCNTKDYYLEGAL